MISVILSGGKSSRMGKDKALLPFGKQNSLVQYQYEKLKGIFTKVYISAKDDKFDFQVNLIKDNDTESSPLVALISIFESIEEDEAFIIAVDSPFVDKKVINEILIGNSNNADIIVAKNNEKVEPLCGIYKRAILPLAKDQIQKGDHKLQNLIIKSKSKFIDFNEDFLFLNLNRPSDYQQAINLTNLVDI